MEKDILQNATMEITLTVMGAVETVKLKLDFHVMVVLQAQKMFVALNYQQQSRLKIEDNQDYSEK